MAAHRLVAALRRLRREQGLSQSELANALGSPGGQPFISRLENGGHDPLLATVDSWAQALGYDVVLTRKET